jgi:hypothetical protein
MGLQGFGLGKDTLIRCVLNLQIYFLSYYRTGAIAASVLGLVTISLFTYVLVLPWFTGQKINVRTLYRVSIADRETV